MAEESTTEHPSTRQIEGVVSDRLHAILGEITAEIKDRLKADRVSVFLFDRENCELWSVVSQEKKTMCLDARLGIAGHVAMTGEVVNVEDAYEHPLFYKEVDLETGYRTRTLLAVPLRNSRGEVMAVGEAVNKYKGRFTGADAEAMQTLVAPIAKTLEGISFKKPGGVIHTFERPGEGFSTQKIVGMSHKVESIIRLIDQIRDCSVDVLIQAKVERVRNWWPGRYITTVRGPMGRLSHSTVPPCPTISSKRNFSASKRGSLPVSSDAQANSRQPIAAPCFSTKSATLALAPRPNSCAPCKNEPSTGSVPPNRSPSTSGSSPPPTATSSTLFAKNSFAKTYITGLK